MSWTVATTAPPPLRQPTKGEVRAAATLFLLVLALGVALLVVAIVLLRLRSHRRRVASVIGLARDESAPPVDPARPRLDPWSESARRISVEPAPPKPDNDDDDTVDLDPGDLGPDDIEPRDSPHNGTGSH